MKFFFFLLSYCMLYLSCLPCRDSKDCSEQADVKISAASGHQQQHQDEENCTPFCNCACCASASCFTSFNRIAFDPFTLQSVNYPTGNTTLHATEHCAIFQPPKSA
ncbi:MAG: DUF6660 family protein [Chitinophagaceae bacterium]